MRKLDLHDKGRMVEALWNTVNHGSVSLEHVPMMIRNVIETEAWREHIHDEKVYRNETFLDFITGKPMQGCGWPPAKVEALISNDAEVLAMWRAATTGKPGRPSKQEGKADNVSIKPGHGNARAYTLDRLKRERPDLFAKVCDGELSANAAAIEAGFRKKPTLLKQFEKLVAKMSDAERRRAHRYLDQLCGFYDGTNYKPDPDQIPLFP